MTPAANGAVSVPARTVPSPTSASMRNSPTPLSPPTRKATAEPMATNGSWKIPVSTTVMIAASSRIPNTRQKLCRTRVRDLAIPASGPSRSSTTAGPARAKVV